MKKKKMPTTKKKTTRKKKASAKKTSAATTTDNTEDLSRLEPAKDQKILKCKKCGEVFTVHKTQPNRRVCPIEGCGGVAHRFDIEARIENVEVALDESKLSYRVKKYDRGIITPELDENFYVSRENQDLMAVVESLSHANPVNIQLVGPQGCGKTEFAVWFAAKYDRRLLILNCASVREPRDWFGFKDASEGSIYWHRADFVRALEEDRCVILFDEFNRVHTSIHNTLYGILDSRRATWIEEVGEHLTVADQVVFFASCNEGITHHGTFQTDSAMGDRWGIRIDVDFLPDKKEAEVLIKKTGIDKDLAYKLCKLAKAIRRKADEGHSTDDIRTAVSTRQLLTTCQLSRQMIASGVEPLQAVKKSLEYTVVPFYSKAGKRDSAQAQILQMIQGAIV